MKIPRKYKRKTYSNEVSFTVQSIAYTGLSENLGAGGIYINTDESFSVGDPIVLTLPLFSEDKTATFHGKIIRVMADGIAVGFIK